MEKIRVGLFGFGCVGRGVYENVIRHYNDQIEISKVCIRNTKKSRNVSDVQFTTDSDSIINDPEIDLVVELIDDSNEALKIISASLKAGKDVISANKSAIARNFRFLVDLQQKTGRSLLYEGAAAAAIPVIRLLESHYSNERIEEIEGILNGSTNYLLSKIRLENKSFEEALKEAQEKGFAESDPSLDIDGWDASYKLIILAAHAFGFIYSPEEVRKTGFREFLDSNPGTDKNWKSIARAKSGEYGVDFSVDFQELTPRSSFSPVEYEWNAVRIHSSIGGENTLYGRGAGADATASAVLADIFQWQRGFRYTYQKFHGQKERLKRKAQTLEQRI